MDQEKKTVLCCWMGKREALEDAHDEAYGPGSFDGSVAELATYAPGWRDGTCLLPANHAGEHVFTDDEVVFRGWFSAEDRRIS